MFLVDLKISLRSLIKQRKFTLINLLGLSIGLCACFLILIFVSHELSYDKFYPKHERIVRVPMTWTFGETTIPSANATSAVGVDLKEAFPEIENFVRFNKRRGTVFQLEDKKFEVEAFCFADTSFFSVFDVTLLQGDVRTALKEPNSIVLTEKSAVKYFGNSWFSDGVLEKQILVNNKTNYVVKGVMGNLPANTHIQFNVLASFSTLDDYQNPNWDNSEFPTYLLLDQNSASNLPATIKKFQTEVERMFPDEPAVVKLDLEPLTSIYLDSKFHNGMGKQSDMTYLYIFSAVGLLILLMACINYVNMSTAHALNRAKEVGMKKVSGALKSDLFSQFMLESASLVFLSSIIGLILVILLKEWFDNITGITITLETLFTPGILIPILIIFVFVTLLAGIYPAIILSGFEPAKVLKGKFSRSNQGRFLRKTLVVLQFSISLFLMAFTYIIFMQMQLVHEQNLGYDKEQTLIVPTDQTIIDSKEPLREKIKQLPFVKEITFASRPPIDIGAYSAVRQLDKTAERQLISYLITDKYYLKTFDLPIAIGKDFTEVNYPDSAYVYIINEAAMQFFGWNEENVIGKKIEMWGHQEGEVIGVAKNFNFQSLKSEISPLLMVSAKMSIRFNYNMMIKLDKNVKPSNALTQIKQIWDINASHYPFNFTFMDQEYQKQYEAETRLNKLFIAFSLLALIIAFLGLTGLAAFNTSQRFKEISIRKVLGASISSILVLLSKDYLVLLFIAFCCAIPICHYFTTEWLSNFAYQITLPWQAYFLPAIFITLAALIAVFLQSIKAIFSNPAEILKNE